jgi:hypothetical protein
MLASKFTGLVVNMVCWHDDSYKGNTEVLEESDAVPFNR